MVKSLFYFW